jgi:hypothetical protein
MEKYNGWVNYPTWNINLWLGNDEGLYGRAMELTREAVANNTETVYAGEDDDEGTEVLDRDGAVQDLATSLEEFCDEIRPESGFVADIYGWAVKHVDWREIAEHHVDDEVEA